MESKTLILNTKLITLNEYINIERGNKYASAVTKKKLTEKVAFLAKSFKFELEKGVKYDVAITWYKPDNRIDHDNIAFGIKFILDGLIKAKILENDSPKFINSLHHHFEVDKSRGYISCSVKFIPVLTHETI